LARASAAGAISQRPCSCRPSTGAKQEPESNRGKQSQSIEPTRPNNGEAEIQNIHDCLLRQEVIDAEDRIFRKNRSRNAD
jgi:hypothetical protein